VSLNDYTGRQAPKAGPLIEVLAFRPGKPGLSHSLNFP